MTVEETIALGPVEAWLDAKTRQAVVTRGGRLLIRRSLDDLEWVRWQRRGWKVRHGGTRRDDRPDDGGQGGPAR